MSIDWKKPLARNCTIGLCAASSGVFPNSMMSRMTSGAEYVRMSENSSARTCVTRPESADTMSGKRSVMPPGWMPVPWSVVRPAWHAASSAATSGDRHGKNQPSGVTTFFPERRMRAMSSASSRIGL